MINLIKRAVRTIGRHGRKLFRIAAASAVFCIVFSVGFAVSAASSDPGISLTLNGLTTPSGTANTLQILLLLTLIALAPSILIMMTSFTRIIIFLSFLRNALGTQQTPPNQVLVGIALFLSLFIMSPVINQINTTAYQPLVNGQITTEQAEVNAMKPLRQFMFKQTENASLKTFLSMAGTPTVKSLDNIPNSVLIPAFVISELKRAFMMGFLIYLPFLIIDVIVGTTLMSMGMMMLPPTMISLPLKLALFVLVDGWGLTVQSLVYSFK
ncbi:flagellar type III secretion system pore protein FliP [Ethanoligenens harbinense]|uniref:Flagellar biosynthetic protein FliP n=1 Tax=Ethanoligenens harbinense (strain DSM 18485 / JCM 12961 / CGMCC 1.5033 / YUAN-3) TaxID=663278 RepID=E6U6I6_ETHHY|nr:flagellar type III secretion system pore protein FliP [Ethanoligenens harbinense]ADU28056.1 flagellar biosynthetic protein FliP [Ethanoligenens harbinense YUAN-3]AVQ97071.1 flagellar biosynthetic protein FliP [Ethanoligenens harbinense YUAN-3]AYF39733.1 flagellar biosynthetic protein FliP [Ethanoligenens harbinense]AYF42566.1 flagellar biosynthetic protein FliP [Ethanoligenens harbinense]QCN93314.1 flagellar biosynthetic protein FliP [Ethanoligenens harbinense]